MGRFLVRAGGEEIARINDVHGCSSILDRRVGKAIAARFDGGKLSTEGGLLALREIESRLGLADRLADCLKDPRPPERVRSITSNR